MSNSGYGYDRITGEKFASRSEVIGQNGMVATSHPLATQIGLDVLKQGGTAVDAAIAANIALGLMEPTGNGIGGDLFAIVWDAETKNLHGLNASGPAPKNISIEYLEHLHPHKLKKVTEKDNISFLAGAIRCGSTRLIDHVFLMKRSPIIAIDGPAGSGKSTVTKLIAKKLKLLYLDTEQSRILIFSHTLLYDPYQVCLLYTSDAADEGLGVDLGGRRIIKKT